MNQKRILPPTYFIITIALMVLFHFLVPIFEFVSFPWTLFGLLPLAVGVVFNLKADAKFKKVKTTVKPFEKSALLVTTDVFGVSRNPMYLGMMLILFGIALLLGSLIPFILAGIFGVLMELIFIRTEEKMMEKQFGREWIAYMEKVRKWV